MINAVPFFFGPPGSPQPATGQTGGVGLDQAKTTDNSSNNPFAKIFRDQSTVAFLLNGSSNQTSGNDEGRVSNPESLPGTQAVSGDLLPFLYLTRILEGDEHPVLEEDNGHRATKEADVVDISSIPLTAEGVNGSSEVGREESQNVLLGVLPEYVSQDEPVLGAVVSSLAILPGKAGGEKGPIAALNTQAGLPFFTGTSSSQTPSVGGMLTDQSPTDLVTNVEKPQALSNIVRSLVGEAAKEPDTNQAKTVDRASSLVQDTDLRLPRSAPSPIEPQQGPLKPVSPAVNQAFQPPAPFEDTPAGLADVIQSSQNRLKYVSGVSSVLSESSANGKESSIGIPQELLRDTNGFLTGDRSGDVLEATGKAGGVDPNAGQGLNNGMGSPTHSQSGFQQSPSSLSQGPAVRIAEERAPDPPTPPLQRLQMEVQLSETNRVQIDVGVQHRQVYASLLMDQATLKNLALQFVPQLEEQLTHGEMELQEFSAEVRDHQGGQESDTRSDGAGTQMGQRGAGSLTHASGSLSHVVRRAEEQGLHLVA